MFKIWDKVEMVDSNTIIEGTVKFRDGKKVIKVYLVITEYQITDLIFWIFFKLFSLKSLSALKEFIIYLKVLINLLIKQFCLPLIFFYVLNCTLKETIEASRGCLREELNRTMKELVFVYAKIKKQNTLIIIWFILIARM